VFCVFYIKFLRFCGIEKTSITQYLTENFQGYPEKYSENSVTYWTPLSILSEMLQRY